MTLINNLLTKFQIRILNPVQVPLKSFCFYINTRNGFNMLVFKSRRSKRKSLQIRNQFLNGLNFRDITKRSIIYKCVRTIENTISDVKLYFSESRFCPSFQLYWQLFVSNYNVQHERIFRVYQVFFSLITWTV